MKKCSRRRHRIRARLAWVYLQLGNTVSAEAEARVARDRNGNEADYLPVLSDALLRQAHDCGANLAVLPEMSIRAALSDRQWK